MMFEDEDPGGPRGGSSDPAADRPTGAIIDHPRHIAHEAPRPRVFPPPAYREVVAGWPDDRRERWGRRANELEEAGLSWRDAEAQAFVEVWSLARQDRRGVALAPSGSDPERN